jgi:hypothetical protein
LIANSPTGSSIQPAPGVVRAAMGGLAAAAPQAGTATPPRLAVRIRPPGTGSRFSIRIDASDRFVLSDEGWRAVAGGDPVI